MEDRDAGGAPARDADPLIGKLLAGRFRILELVARGGMGMIYRAEQLPLGRVVALKVLAPMERHDAEEDAFRRRFEREAAMCARLAHSNTVRIFDFGRAEDGVYYIAMEFIRGRTLHQVLRAEAPLPPARVVHIVRQIASSLAEAHALGIVHRDLKPGNVLLTTQNDDPDFVKVVDFGLVKHMQDDDITNSGMIVGSPNYMSPEQVRGSELDLRSDIYALGTLAYVALTGKRPFDRDSTMAALMARVTHKPPPLRAINPNVSVPSSLDWIVTTALETRAEDRFASMEELLRALKVVDAELRGDPGPFRLALDRGRTVLPVDFTDPSLTRGRASESSGAARAAGLSLLAFFTAGAVVVALGMVAAIVVFGLRAQQGSTEAAGRVPVAASAPLVDGAVIPVDHAAGGEVAEAEPVAPLEPVERDEPVGVAEPVAPVRAAPRPRTAAPARAPDPPRAVPSSGSGPAPTVVADPPPTEESQWKVRSDIKENPFR